MIIIDIDYNRKLDSKNGVYYDENGRLCIDESRVVVDTESISYHFPHQCIWNNSDCSTCTQNEDYSLERMRISPLSSKETFVFERIVESKRGACWTNWQLVQKPTPTSPTKQ